jgi:hypothetical protein
MKAGACCGLAFGQFAQPISLHPRRGVLVELLFGARQVFLGSASVQLLNVMKKESANTGDLKKMFPLLRQRMFVCFHPR